MAHESHPSSEQIHIAVPDQCTTSVQSICRERFLEEHFPNNATQMVWIADTTEHHKFRKRIAKKPGNFELVGMSKCEILQKHEKGARLKICVTLEAYTILADGTIIGEPEVVTFSTSFFISNVEYSEIQERKNKDIKDRIQSDLSAQRKKLAAYILALSMVLGGIFEIQTGAIRSACKDVMSPRSNATASENEQSANNQNEDLQLPRGAMGFPIIVMSAAKQEEIAKLLTEVKREIGEDTIADTSDQ